MRINYDGTTTEDAGLTTSGGDSSTDYTSDTDPTQDAGSYDSSPIGAGSVETTVDLDTGDVSQEIAGGAGSSTTTAEQSDDVTVVDTQPADVDAMPSDDTVQDAVEEAVAEAGIGTTTEEPNTPDETPPTEQANAEAEQWRQAFSSLANELAKGSDANLSGLSSTAKAAGGIALLAGVIGYVEVAQ